MRNAHVPRLGFASRLALSSALWAFRVSVFLLPVKGEKGKPRLAWWAKKSHGPATIGAPAPPEGMLWRGLFLPPPAPSSRVGRRLRQPCSSAVGDLFIAFAVRHPPPAPVFGQAYRGVGLSGKCSPVRGAVFSVSEVGQGFRADAAVQDGDLEEPQALLPAALTEGRRGPPGWREPKAGGATSGKLWVLLRIHLDLLPTFSYSSWRFAAPDLFLK